MPSRVEVNRKQMRIDHLKKLYRQVVHAGEFEWACKGNSS